jgi:hypothetical protein
MQMDNVDFVVDSKTTNGVFHSNRLDVSEFDHVILGCQRLFHSQFTNSRVEFWRKTNTIAPLFIFISVIVLLVLVLLIKCYKHFSFKKRNPLNYSTKFYNGCRGLTQLHGLNILGS